MIVENMTKLERTVTTIQNHLGPTLTYGMSLALSVKYCKMKKKHVERKTKEDCVKRILRFETEGKRIRDRRR